VTKKSPRSWPGNATPLGATWDGDGTNFALYSEGAEAVDLSLFDGGNEHRMPLEEVTAHVWHGYLPGVSPGQLYGFRCDGPFAPEWGARWNPSKLLLDPYAKAIAGNLRLDDAIFGYPRGRDHMVQDHRDSAPHVPRSVVVHDSFPWGDDRKPHTAWADTVIYEVHVKGFTMLNPDVPPELRGTYAGLGHPSVIDHLKRLGVTAVELLPTQHFVDEPALLKRGLTNYWGYNTIGYFAPHAAYCSSGQNGEQVREFKAMVRAMHAAGIEVILDVVYNHTAEGDEWGPTICFRGIDNGAYYKLAARSGALYTDYSGCGNALNVRHPHVLQLIMDSLRYWVTEMHVDGFRFDLASALARSFHEVDKLSAFFNLVQQDPVISKVKLIAEPWDLGEGGYQVGEFPPLWTEWNGKYRDTVRDFWRGGEPNVSEIAARLSGSSDLYQHDGRRPYASINFVTAHDGFTLHDLVTYEKKHNDANGEHNRDGTDENKSWNCGVEGETTDPAIQRLRRRQQRNLLATLLLSAGVPMLAAGDELDRTQNGNNNAYCQDNATSWVEWQRHTDAGDLLSLTRRLLALRNAHPVFRRRAFFLGMPVHGSGAKDIGWFGPKGGEEMEDGDWSAPGRTLGVFLNGDEIVGRGPRGERVVDESFLILLHAAPEPIDFTLPGAPWATGYVMLVDTAADGRYEPNLDVLQPGDAVAMAAYSMVVLSATR
jgi:glycogen operon protein